MRTNLVCDSFSQSARQYDQHASVQREAARRLANFIAANDGRNSLEPIIEIGCGTGMLSELLLQMYPEHEIILTDVSQEMLDMCEFKLRARIAGVESNEIVSEFQIGAGEPPALQMTAGESQEIGLQSESSAARMSAVQKTGVAAVPVVKNADVEFNEIGPESDAARMAAIQRTKSSARPARIEFRKYDADSLEPVGPCGTIFSSFALQWVTDLEKTLAHLVASASGAVYFSLPCDDSFPEWRQYADLAGVQCTINCLPRVDNLISFCERNNFHIQYEHYNHAMNYASALSFFRSLKASGASSSLSGKTLSTSQFQRLIETWDTQSASILSTYSIINAKVWRSQA